jgi:hypothetical protein
VTNNLPLSGIQVRLYPRRGVVPTGACLNYGTAGQNCELGGGFENGFSAVTNANGIALFSGRVEGKYYPVVMGNGQYAAVDLDNTVADNTNSTTYAKYRDARSPFECDLQWGRTATCSDIKTIQKGSLKGELGGVDYDVGTGKFFVEGPLTAGTSFYFQAQENFSYLFNLASPHNAQTGFTWAHSLARNALTPVVNTWGVEATDSSEFTLDSIAPSVINATTTTPSATGAELQGQRLLIRAGVYRELWPGFWTYATPAPYTPVIVRFINGDPNRPSFLISAPPFLTKSSPGSTTPSDFNFPLFTNGVSVDNGTFSMGLLKAGLGGGPATKTLASATGKILNGSGSNTFPNPTVANTFNYHTVHTYFSLANTGLNSGSGGIGYYAAGDCYYLDPALYYVTDVFGASYEHRFTFTNNLIPNLDPSETQAFYFRAERGVGTGSSSFQSNVKVWTRNSAGQYIQVASPSLGNSLTLRFRYWSNGFQSDGTLGGVGFSAGVMSFNRDSYVNEYYTASFPAVHLDPGTTTSVPDATLTKVSSQRTYIVDVVSDSSDQVEYIPPQNPLYFGSIPFYWGGSGYAPSPGMAINFATRVSSHFSGYVRTVGLQPIVGANVTLCATGMVPACLQTSTNNQGRYDFPNSDPASTVRFSLYDLEHPVFESAGADSFDSSGIVYPQLGAPPYTDIQYNFTLPYATGGSGGAG